MSRIRCGGCNYPAVVKLVCKLTFADGQQVTGQVHAAAPAVKYPFIYSGDTDRLAIQCFEGTLSDLELIFTVTAQRTGAKLIRERTGDYDSKAR